ncbi:MAG: hypothetical protein K5905_02530 [Roseibium sp.]|uniref:hypothetical protein n=1 Tax=Roseibium sp. TaxID=1936156 RepID=UPI0026027E5C|nr:hypothetical protein [Roseibium sp.]MCV0424325.1 hypothetical protein [Roseibium sp.]
MQFVSSGVSSQTLSRASFPPALLYMLATGLLILMCFALVPALALLLIAFAAMAVLTKLLGQRLFRELTDASNRDGT